MGLTNRMQRTPRLRLGCTRGVCGAGWLILGVRPLRTCSHKSHVSLQVGARKQKRLTRRYAGSRAHQIVRRIAVSAPFCTVTSLALSSASAMATPDRRVGLGSGFHEVRQMFRSFRSTRSDNMERDLGDSYVWSNKIAAPNRRLHLGLVPWSFGTLTSQGSAVGEL
jgi:hypothetical protein